jgi:hypothetical protein
MELEPTTLDIEALQLAGQIELEFAMNSLAHLLHIPEVMQVTDRLLERHQDLRLRCDS